MSGSAEACYRYNHSPKGIATRRAWLEKNRKTQRARVQAWTEAHKEELKEYRKAYYKENRLKLSLRGAKEGAAKRKLVYDIPDALVLDLMTDVCFYCGDASTINGIDRVDNSRGYVEDNVVTACKACNRAKHARTREEFETWALRLAANLQRWQTTAA